MENNYSWIVTTSLFLADLAIRIGFSLRVIMRKRAASVSIAWLVVILLIPFAGAALYLLFGENRLGERRASRLVRNRAIIKDWPLALKTRPDIDWTAVNPECIPLDRQISAATGIPTMPGNQLELIADAGTFFRQLIADINQAHISIALEFYILGQGGWVDVLTEALMQARARGVSCRILLDSIGAKQFLRSAQATRLRDAGIELLEALPAGLIRALFVRIDLRNHRKIAIVDGKIAYTGSQNLVDPRFFKQHDGVGEWVDAMVRITGPVVEALTATFVSDWLLESKTAARSHDGSGGIQQVEPAGSALVQLAPSGPGYGEDTIHNLLLTTIYAARRELILTTPYFVPDNAILAALKSAAQRGVRVTVIVPEKNDSKLVHYASHAHYDALASAGVGIVFFTGGLLHTKTITIDGDFCLFGSVNLDMRSFWLNFEMTLFIYDRAFTAQVRSLQQKYMAAAKPYCVETSGRRSFRQRLLENIALLVGPLL